MAGVDVYENTGKLLTKVQRGGIIGQLGVKCSLWRDAWMIKDSLAQ